MNVSKIAINGFFGRMGQTIYEESMSHNTVKITIGCDLEEKIKFALSLND